MNAAWSTDIHLNFLKQNQVDDFFPAKVMYSPRLRTFLSYKGKRQDVSFHSIIDSGADYCVFPAKFGESIGLDLTKGDHFPSYGVGGKDILYFHNIQINIGIDA